MSQLYKYILIILLPVIIGAYLIHNYIFSNYFSGQEINYSIEVIYVIVSIITLINITGIHFVNKLWKDKTGFAFMIFGVIKMFLIIFLIVKIRLNNEVNIIFDGVNIVIAYFVSLIVESYISVKVLKGND